MQVRLSFGDGPASSYLKHHSQVVMHVRFGREVCGVAAHFSSGCKINTDALLSRFYMLYSSSGITLTHSFRNCKINGQLTFLFEARLVSKFKTIHLFFSTEVRNVKLISPQNSFACQDRACEKYGIQIC